MPEVLFQSTLPARGATYRDATRTDERRISIHAPRTGSDDTTTGRDNHDHDFNPRSPHGERLGRRERPKTAKRFQSTLPARGATLHSTRTPRAGDISIHAPRTGSDIRNGQPKRTVCRHFNPRSPHGERRASSAKHPAGWIFQSTLPARGAT